MSAVKRVFTHSAIRSPIRNPFVPNDDGYREYLKRSVFELNGTQDGAFSDDFLVDADTPFKLQWIAYASSFTNNGLMDLADYDALGLPRSCVNINASGEFVFQLGSNYYNAGEVVISQSMDNKLCVIELNRSANNTVSALINGNLISTTFMSGAVRFDKCFVFGGTRFTGIPFGLLGWVDDSLILNVPLDESGSGYQRNRAVALGAELYSDSFVLPEFFSRDGNIITKTDATSETIFIANVEAGKHYRLSFRKDSHSAGTPNLRDQLKSQYIFPLMSTLEPTGKTYEFVFTATTDGQVGINGTASLWSVSELSIKEFHGVVLQNALPEDWMQIEKQRWWDYWREVGNESNILEIAQ